MALAGRASSLLRAVPQRGIGLWQGHFAGRNEVLYFKYFNSGAMIQNIVNRAKKMGGQGIPRNRSEGARVLTY
jgi:hypothetical protein